MNYSFSRRVIVALGKLFVLPHSILAAYPWNVYCLYADNLAVVII